jgi:hypothetical protein
MSNWVQGRRAEPQGCPQQVPEEGREWAIFGFSPVAAMPPRRLVGAGAAVVNATRQMTDRTESGVRLLATTAFQILDFRL